MDAPGGSRASNGWLYAQSRPQAGTFHSNDFTMSSGSRPVASDSGRVVPPVPNAAAGRNLASRSGRGIGSELFQCRRSPLPARLRRRNTKGCRHDEMSSLRLRLCVLLAVFLAGMITTAQGQSEPTLALLRSGARPLSSVAYPNSPRLISLVLTVSSPVWIAR